MRRGRAKMKKRNGAFTTSTRAASSALELLCATYCSVLCFGVEIMTSSSAFAYYTSSPFQRRHSAARPRRKETTELRSFASDSSDLFSWDDDENGDHFRVNGFSSSSKPKNTSNNNNSQQDIDFKIHPSILDIDAQDWNDCVQSNNPFLEHAFLASLEQSGCVGSADSGWIPRHVSIQLNNVTQGYAPMYLKRHSLGEFIFDQAWAEAAYSNGILYYPKLLVAVPFTPATGQRILWRSSLLKNRQFNSEQQQQGRLKQLRRAFGHYLQQLAKSHNISSVHINFLTDSEANDLAGPLHAAALEERTKQESSSSSSSSSSKLHQQVSKMLERFKPQNVKKKKEDDYIRRTSIQYHWKNRNPQKQGNKPFVSFQDYLASCFKSKRRISIRRERRRVLKDENIRIDVLQGREAIRQIPGLVPRMFEIYLSTIQKMTLWGRQYLSLEFFELLVASDFCDNLCFVCARRNDNQTTTETSSGNGVLRAEDVFAGTINVIKDGVFYGRYWGCLPGKQVNNLHFEVCYWSAIEYCIKQGLKRMEPGAGGGDYKWARGFDPTLVHSVHYISNPGLRRAIRQYVDYETENNIELTDYLRRKRTGKDTAAVTV